MAKITAESLDTTPTPRAILAAIRSKGGYANTKGGRRKLRLFGCASARRMRPLMTTPAEARFLEKIERAAVEDDDLPAVVKRWQVFVRRNGCEFAVRRLAYWMSCDRAWESAGTWQLLTGPDWPLVVPHDFRGRLPTDQDAERHVHADLARCVFGNPLRPVAFPAAWRTAAAVGLAAGVHDSRDFARLPILADALEEAGCDDPHVLAHCRTHPHHALGCWVTDGVLQK